MIDLFFYTVVRRPDPWKGTPGELIPTFDFRVFHDRVAEDAISAYKQTVTNQHKENMKFMPPEWQKKIPEPTFWERPHNITYEI